MYKYIESKKTTVPFEKISGIDKLLTKLEYNAVTTNGKHANDFGVPYKIVDYYESQERAAEIMGTFDAYENKVFKKVMPIIKEQEEP